MSFKRTRFGYHFSILHRLIVTLSKQRVMGLGIQSSLLPFIAELLHYAKPVTQDELSASLVFDKSATTRALDQLEQNGFVQREINSENRRQKLVTATDKARTIRAELDKVLDDTSDVLTQGFSPEEMDQVSRLLNKMIANGMKARS